MSLVLNHNTLLVGDPDDGALTATYIGRGGKWGNPYPLTSSGRVICLSKYLDHLIESKLWRDMSELRGKNLICFCVPLLCHGHLLVHLSERENLDENYLNYLRCIAYHEPDRFVSIVRGEARSDGDQTSDRHAVHPMS